MIILLFYYYFIVKLLLQPTGIVLIWLIIIFCNCGTYLVYTLMLVNFYMYPSRLS